MSIVIKPGVDNRKPIAFVRDGELFFGLNVWGSKQKNGILNLKTGVVTSNGEGTIPNISNWGGTLIYPGDTVTITFEESK